MTDCHKQGVSVPLTTGLRLILLPVTDKTLPVSDKTLPVRGMRNNSYEKQCPYGAGFLCFAKEDSCAVYQPAADFVAGALASLRREKQKHSEMEERVNRTQRNAESEAKALDPRLR